MRRPGSLKPLRNLSPSGCGLDLSRSVASPCPAEASWPLSRRAEQLAPCRLCQRCALTIERLILVLASRWTVPQTFKIGAGCFWMGNHPAHFMWAAVVGGARVQTCLRPTSLQVGPRLISLHIDLQACAGYAPVRTVVEMCTAAAEFGASSGCCWLWDRPVGCPQRTRGR